MELIQKRGHYFKIIDADNKQILIADIYAPQGYILNTMIKLIQRMNTSNSTIQ